MMGDEGSRVSGLPFDRSPFEHQVAGMLGSAVAGAAAPAGAGGGDPVAGRGAPGVVAALATVNTIAAPPAMRARVASAVAASAAAVGGVAATGGGGAAVVPRVRPASRSRRTSRW